MSAVSDSGWLVAPYTTLNDGKITLLDVGSGHIVSVQTRLDAPAKCLVVFGTQTSVTPCFSTLARLAFPLTLKP